MSEYKAMLEKLTAQQVRELHENKPIVTRYLVFAPSHNHFKQWCVENGIHKPSRDVIWINDRKRVAGLTANGWLVVVADDSFIGIEVLLRFMNLHWIYDYLDTHGFEWQHDSDKVAMRDWIAYRIQQQKEDAKIDKQISKIIKKR